jgi:hypothetical protein
VPHDIAAAVVGHDVATVDRNMEYQQNVPASGLALVVLRARSTRVTDLLLALPALLAALPTVAVGTVTHVRGA